MLRDRQTENAWNEAISKAEGVVRSYAFTSHKAAKSVNVRNISFDPFVKGGTFKDGGTKQAYDLVDDAISESLTKLCPAHLRYAPTSRAQQALIGYSRNVLATYQMRPTSIGGRQRTAGQQVESMTDEMVALAAAPASESEAVEIAEEAQAILAMLTDDERSTLDHLKQGSEPSSVTAARTMKVQLALEPDAEMETECDRRINAWHAKSSRAKKAVAAAMLERELEVVA